MNPGTLIRLNRRLCVRQQKSNPYRVRVRTLGKTDTTSQPLGAPCAIRYEPVFESADSVESEGRCTTLWKEAAFAALCISVAFGIVAFQRLDYRRAEHRLAVELRNLDRMSQQMAQVNQALSAQLKTVVGGTMPAGQVEIQPAAFTPPIATNRFGGGRM